jgi:hypothetical protein
VEVMSAGQTAIIGGAWVEADRAVMMMLSKGMMMTDRIVDRSVCSVRRDRKAIHFHLHMIVDNIRIHIDSLCIFIKYHALWQ